MSIEKENSRASPTKILNKFWHPGTRENTQQKVQTLTKAYNLIFATISEKFITDTKQLSQKISAYK